MSRRAATAPNDRTSLASPVINAIRIVVVAAHGLAKPNVFSLPDPFAVVFVDSEQTRITSVTKKTLNPYWNEHFDLMVKRSSVITVQIFDQHKFGRLDQGFLGFVEIRVTDYLDLELGSQELVLLDLKGTDGNPVVQGKLISHLSTNLTTSATSSRPTDSSLALTYFPSNDYDSVNNDGSVNNYSVDNDSFNNNPVDNYSANNYSVNNASVYTASVNSASVSELYSPSISLSRTLSSHSASSEVMAIPTTVIPRTHLEPQRSLPDILIESSTSASAHSLPTGRPDKQQELAKEVQRRAEAAMADINRMPSNPRGHDTSQRKHVELGQISEPKLVSASTSVDTITMRSESVASGQLSAVQNQSPTSSKFGTRLKTFRGSLRAKPTSGASQHPGDLPSINGDPSLAATPDVYPSFSATEPSLPKPAIASPRATVATSGPELKGFASHILRPRPGETPEPDQPKQGPSSSTSVPISSYFAQQQSGRRPEMGVSRQISQSVPPDNKFLRPDITVPPESSPVHKQPPSAPPLPSSVPGARTTRAVVESGLKQLIDAANNLSLDQDTLKAFIARSATIGSRLTAQSSKHLSTTSGNRRSGNSDPPSEPAPASAPGSTAQRSPVQTQQRLSGEIVEKAPIRRPLARNGAPSESADSTIVRSQLRNLKIRLPFQ